MKRRTFGSWQVVAISASWLGWSVARGLMPYQIMRGRLWSSASSG